MFKKQYNEVTKEERNRARAINYGIIYGTGPTRLASVTGVSQKEARSFIKQYFVGFPQMKQFFDGNLKLAKETGFIRTHLGRKRPVSFAGDSKELSHAKNVASTAMIMIDRELELDAEQLLQVMTIWCLNAPHGIRRR
jgi:DNA polymerase I-like protein with 3'-5' exonuclease and polymerase domains